MTEIAARGLGAIYTPVDMAEFLTAWAIQQPTDQVLDVGTGEGVFVFSAHRRLRALGAASEEAQTQIYGAEIDPATYARFTAEAAKDGLHFPSVHQRDFFDLELPPLDAVVGNPPYVRRTYIDEVDKIRQKVFGQHGAVDKLPLTRLTDLYVYCLLRAFASLKPGGRVAVITADPWLTMGYGEGLKQYLNQHFEIEGLISFDRRVFDNADVKPVLLLATKRAAVNVNHFVSFVRVKNGLSVSRVNEVLQAPALQLPDLVVRQVPTRDLEVEQPWSIHFKAPELYDELASHPLMTPIASIASTRIGLQTLAKDFFVLTAEQARRHEIEPEYLKPLAHSSRLFKHPLIKPEQAVPFYVFYCSKTKEELRNTQALQYILMGEQAEVPLRGKDATVTGYHQKERIQRTGRRNWYDLKSDLERRGLAAILIPRLVYRTYTVVWNKAGYVPGELFIEFLPLPLLDIAPEVYLAILTSTLTEVMLRVHAQVYGGGTYNINPGDVKRVPILNATLLSPAQQEALKQAYHLYLDDDQHDRCVIDTAIYQVLQIDITKQRQLAELLTDLIHVATSSKKAGDVE